MKALDKIISAIASLEEKQFNGTITMDEEAILCTLIERAEEIIYN